MDSGIYVAVSGADQLLQSQRIRANNLANMNTDGFRADLTHFLSREADGPGFDSRVFASMSVPKSDFSPGAIRPTGRELDVAIAEKGFFAVQDKDGKEAYTRAGSLRINEIGQLTTSSGYPVLGNGGAIAIPEATRIDIAADGNISIQPRGQALANLAIIDRLKLVNPDLEKMYKGTNGLFYTDQATQEPDPEVKVVPKALEGSNVSPITEMVNMLGNAREYERLTKMMENMKQTDEQSSTLLRVEG